jgi:hypothetical protein
MSIWDRVKRVRDNGVVCGMLGSKGMQRLVRWI